MENIPLYKQIQNRIKEQIQTRVLRPGDQVFSEKDICEHYRVSQITAKNALNGLAEEGVVTRIKGKGTFVSKNKHLFHADKGFIGLVLPSMKTEIDNKILNYLEYYLFQENYQILIRITRESSVEETLSLQTYRDMGVKGIIIFPTESENYNDFILQLAYIKFPLVLIDRYFKKINTYSVVSDNVQGSFDVVSYLLKKGHRKIALISPEITNSVTEDRAKGFENAFLEWDFSLNKNMWCLPDLSIIKSGKSELYIRHFFERRSNVTAAFTLNNELANYTASALRNLKRSTPEDVELITFDQSYDSGTPYVNQDIETMCKEAVDFIIEQINGINNPKQHIVPVKLCFPSK